MQTFGWLVFFEMGPYYVAQAGFRVSAQLILLLGREIWRGKMKKVENLEMSTVGRGIWQEN